MNGYVFHFQRKSLDVYASTLDDARKQAIASFNPPKSQRHMVHGMIAERDVDAATGKGTPVVHSPTF